MAEVIRVLVVDDSAFVRKIVKQMLGRSPFIEVVGTARDGAEAIELIAELRPDVITLDLVMPRMDGIQFLRQQRKEPHPVPVVICSISHQSGALALQALELGAVDFVQKPTALATDRIYEIADELIAKVKMAHSSGRRPAEAGETVPIVAPPTSSKPGQATAADVVVLGISTGGPQALRAFIPRLPETFPVPLVVVLHMPLGYTAMYAERLNEISSLRVVEASDHEPLLAGWMYLAPAGQHLSFTRNGTGAVYTHLDLDPPDTQHRPSVDVLFRSAADVFGSRVLGVVMTGMGSDGLLGAAHIQANGGRIITEAESSCVVYGMPRAVAEAGLGSRVATLDEMANAISEMI